MKFKFPRWFPYCFIGCLYNEVHSLDVLSEVYQEKLLYMSISKKSDSNAMFILEFLRRSKSIASSLFDNFIGMSVSGSQMVLAFTTHLGTCKQQDQKLLIKYWTQLILAYKKKYTFISPVTGNYMDELELVKDKYPICHAQWSDFYYEFIKYTHENKQELDDTCTFKSTTSVNSFYEDYHTMVVMDSDMPWENLSRNHQLLLVIFRASVSLISHKELGLSQMMSVFETVFVHIKYPGVTNNQNSTCILKPSVFYVEGYLQTHLFDTDSLTSYGFLPALTQAIYDERFVVSKPTYSDSEVLAIIQMCGFTYSKLEGKKDEFGLQESASNIWLRWKRLNPVKKFSTMLQHLNDRISTTFGFLNQILMQRQSVSQFVEENKAYEFSHEEAEEIAISFAQRQKWISDLDQMITYFKGMEFSSDSLKNYFCQVFGDQQNEKILFIVGPARSGKTTFIQQFKNAFPGLNGCTDRNLLTANVGRIANPETRSLFCTDESMHGTINEKSCLIDKFHLLAANASCIYNLSSEHLRSSDTMYFITSANDKIKTFEKLAAYHNKVCLANRANLKEEDGECLVSQAKRRITFLRLINQSQYGDDGAFLEEDIPCRRLHSLTMQFDQLQKQLISLEFMPFWTIQLQSLLSSDIAISILQSEDIKSLPYLVFFKQILEQALMSFIPFEYDYDLDQSEAVRVLLGKRAPIDLDEYMMDFEARQYLDIQSSGNTVEQGLLDLGLEMEENEDKRGKKGTYAWMDHDNN